MKKEFGNFRKSHYGKVIEMVLDYADVS